ncbi:MAG TPA: lysozyme [Agitococcus sp.]|nr:lysozyme [Agitococcus sp.]
MNLDEVLWYAASICRRFEGLYLKPYLCPAGVPTIGYGATFYQDGKKVSLRDKPITREQAEDLLMYHLKQYFLKEVLLLCYTLDTESKTASILDFAFNVGLGNLKVSTLRKRILSKNWEDVPNQLMRWNKANGKVLKGLTLRREAEKVLFILGT